ncbi:DUF2164 domain-containing protein [Heyndrickxia coagulans]|jgi:uncharacterized protein (DUF2164 family)|nr:DUF2164 domain-containing protein [Heyndrickxia coagulans]KGT37614.1 hypothetical protein P421_14300 [Heyndrickxia coagulans P38]NWN95790.1 DUF2164 domain-containing protein [Bacillus sp. (in: firmicutes)]KXT19237.1 hypothetical protein UZ35_16275 [Heyndrickxia coagulans]MBT2195843.1 DUF2164 family protein [Heyndrickxia coagulans]
MKTEAPMTGFKMDPAEKQRVLREIQQFVWEQTGEEIGVIAAQAYFDFFQEKLAAHYYNKGIEDAKKIWEGQNARLEEEWYALEIPVK